MHNFECHAALLDVLPRSSTAFLLFYIQMGSIRRPTKTQITRKGGAIYFSLPASSLRPTGGAALILSFLLLLFFFLSLAPPEPARPPSEWVSRWRSPREAVAARVGCTYAYVTSHADRVAGQPAIEYEFIRGRTCPAGSSTYRC